MAWNTPGEIGDQKSISVRSERNLETEATTMKTIVSGTILDDSERPWLGFLRFTRHLVEGEKVIGDLTPREIPTQSDGGFEIELRSGRYRCEIGNQSPVLITVPEGVNLAVDIDTLLGATAETAGGGYVYWGSSVSESLTGDEVDADLDKELEISLVGSRDFGAGGYKFWAWPNDFGAPRAFNGFRDPQSGSPVVMAGTGEGYTETENGWGYKLISIDGAAFRLYRSLYVINATATFVTLK